MSDRAENNSGPSTNVSHDNFLFLAIIPRMLTWELLFIIGCFNWRKD